MGSDSTNSAATEASAAPGKADVHDLHLQWLFPRMGEPAVRLADEGDRVIGRDASCAVVLAGHDVSRRHAVLRTRASTCTLTDLESRNGVRVNGRRVSSAQLKGGDVVRVGGWVGLVSPAPGTFSEIAPGLFGGASLATAVAPLRQVAPSALPVILQGETGTGKEVAARALHDWSGRSGPLVTVNCAALPETLAEGELFGYRRGAFTGADRASPGLFRTAQGGTLLLDEVADLPLSLQAKLLRVLEQKEVLPLGESQPVAIDVRVVAACQQPLREGVRAGRFRPDLLARLDGLTVHLPALRDRRQDLLPLFSHLLKQLGQGRAPALESDLAERLCIYDWPFNVRELVFLVRRLLALHGAEPTLLASHLPERMREQDTLIPADSDQASVPPHAAKQAPQAESVDLPALVVALRAAGGNVARASALLGITRQRAYRMMESQSFDLEALRKEKDLGS
jgi:transcriptional regulator of acetoin/glycerol metabolism